MKFIDDVFFIKKSFLNGSQKLRKIIKNSRKKKKN